MPKNCAFTLVERGKLAVVGTATAALRISWTLIVAVNATKTDCTNLSANMCSGRKSPAKNEPSMAPLSSAGSEVYIMDCWIFQN